MLQYSFAHVSCFLQEHPKYKQAARARKPEAKLRIMLGACQGVTKDELSGAPQPKYRSETYSMAINLPYTWPLVPQQSYSYLTRCMF